MANILKRQSRQKVCQQLLVEPMVKTGVVYPVPNEYQKAVLAHYSDGVFAYLCDVQTEQEFKEGVDDCDDQMLTYLMAELASSESCHTFEEAMRRIDIAISDLQKAGNALFAAQQSK
jgi:hypothetical protein